MNEVRWNLEPHFAGRNKLDRLRLGRSGGSLGRSRQEWPLNCATTNAGKWFALCGDVLVIISTPSHNLS